LDKNDQLFFTFLQRVCRDEASEQQQAAADGGAVVAGQAVLVGQVEDSLYFEFYCCSSGLFLVVAWRHCERSAAIQNSITQ